LRTVLARSGFDVTVSQYSHSEVGGGKAAEKRQKVGNRSAELLAHHPMHDTRKSIGRFL
jgi:hypothetical protein